MNCLIVGKRRVTAMCAGAVLMVCSMTSASVIMFDADKFSARGTMFAQAGESESELPLPADPFNPFDDYSFDPDHSQNDGIGQATSSISQEFELHSSNGGGTDGFSLSGHAGGQFDSLDPSRFSGRVISGTTFDATFSMNKAHAIQVTGALGASADEFPGSANVFAQIQIFENSGPGAELPIYDQAVFTGGTSVAIDDLLHLEANRNYRLVVSASADAEFDGMITDLHSFQAGFDLNFAVLPTPGAFSLLALAGLIGTRRRRG